MFKKVQLRLISCAKFLGTNSRKFSVTPSIATSSGTKEVAVITGASGAFGRGIAVELASRGYALSLHGRNEKELAETAKECQDFGAPSSDILLVRGDIRSPEDLDSLASQTKDKFGRINALINNAAIANPDDRLERIDLNEFDEIFRVNLRAAFYLTQICMPTLQEAKGTVVNISSIASGMPNAQTLVYGMSKAALDYFTTALANDVGPSGVRVCGVQPGYFPAKLQEGVFPGIESASTEAMNKAIMSMQPLRRIGKVSEIAKTVAFLLSEDASFITGVNIFVDGGMHHPRLDGIFKSRSDSD